jgi:hypothetical protein
VGAFYLRETLPHAQQRRICCGGAGQHRTERRHLLTAEKIQPQACSSPSVGSLDTLHRLSPERNRVGKIMLTIAGYGLLAFSQIVFQEIFVLFCQSRSENGGLGFKTFDVGVLMAVGGINLVLIQLFVYPYIQRRLGTWRTYCAGMGGQTVVIFVTGWLSLFAYSEDKDRGSPYLTSMLVLWTLVVLHHTARNITQTISFTTIMMMMNNIAGSQFLGTVNGAGQALGKSSNLRLSVLILREDQRLKMTL